MILAPSSLRRPLTLLTLAVSLTIALPLTAQGTGTATTSTSKTAPDFTRKDLSGKPIHLASYRGKVVLLNFWATWCGPCLTEMPRFSAWQQKYGTQGLQVLGVSMDDDAAPVQRTYRKYQIAYPVVMGDEHLGELYGGVFGLPITLLIDKNGHVVARYQGEPGLQQLEAKIKSLLHES